MKQQWQCVCMGLVSVALLLSACSPSPEPKTVAPEQANIPQAKPAPKANADFINKVWKVSQSNAVAKEQLYVFLSDGTLVITAPQQKPSLGTWSYQDKKLVMTEDSIAYPVDILALSENSFSIRMHSPGEPVHIQFVDASSEQLD
jgi:hypothetical protein